MAPRAPKKPTTKAKAAPKPAQKTVDLAFVAKAREAIEERVETLGARAKDVWEAAQERVKTVRDGASEAVTVVRTSLEAAGAGVRDVNLKVIECVQADANTYFDTIRKVATAKSIKEALEIQGNYVRGQFQTSLANVRVVGDVALGAARKAIEPVRDGIVSLRKAA